MATSCARTRLAITIAMVMVVSVTASPALAQGNPEPWQVVDSVNIDAAGFAPALSPDGRWVAGLKDLETRQLCIWKVSTGEERCKEESGRVADASIAWSPDSRQVAYSQNGHELDRDVFVLEVKTNSLTNLTEDDVDDLKAAGTASQFVIYNQWPVWSADGTELLFLRILNPRDDQGQRQVAVSRVILATGQVVRGAELVTDEPLALIAETIGVVSPPVWLADGTVIFAVRGGRDITGVYRVDVASGLAAKIESSPGIPVAKTPLVTSATVAGDRLALYWLWEEIAIGDEFFSYGQLDLETGDLSPLIIEAPRGMIVAAPPRFSSDGSAIVYGVTSDEQTHSNASIVIEDLQSGATVEIVEGADLQLWESVVGIEWTGNNQFVVPLDDGSFEIVTVGVGQS